MLEQEARRNVMDNLHTVRRAWIEAVTKHDIDGFIDLHSATVEMYDPTFANPLKGSEALRSWIDNLFKMFPDYKMKEQRIFGHDEWVSVEAEETGTMKGPIHAPGGRIVPATGKSFKISSSIVCRVADGKIAEVRAYYDVLGLMGQLGLEP